MELSFTRQLSRPIETKVEQIVPKTSKITLSCGRQVEVDWPDRDAGWQDKIVWGPVHITLPDGEVIELDWIPYQGWGTEPGKRYTTSKCDDHGNVTPIKSWTVPSACDEILPAASAGNRRQGPHAYEGSDTY